MSRLFLIGAGLMGSSFALAVRGAGLFDTVAAYDVDPAVASRAQATGAIDAVVTTIAAGVRDADAVVVAVPPSHIAPTVAAVVRADETGAAPVFDVGSVKVPVLAGLRAQLGTVPARFVPCHPMAGAATAGPDAADRDLFRGRRVFVTPVAETDAAALARVESIWRACGAVVTVTDATRHDLAVAATSHLPHLLAAAYAARFEQDRALLDFAGPGFRDFTRIAGAEPTLWRDILLSNAESVGAELDRLLEGLRSVRATLAANDTPARLEAVLAAGRRVRQVFAAAGGDDGHVT